MPSSIQEINAFKVVSTDTHTLPNHGGTINSVRSALLNSSKGVTVYKPATPNPQRFYTSPALENTPVIAFDDAAAALAFAAEKSGREVWTLHAYARLVVPVTTVLRLKLGWDEQAKAFWNAYVFGGDLSGFDTTDAPEHSIGIFGVVSLGKRIIRVPVAA